MGKKTADIKTDEPKMSNLTSKILDKLDIDQLADSVAEQISERIMANFAISVLVDRLLQKYQHKLQAHITEAIVDRL